MNKVITTNKLLAIIVVAFVIAVLVTSPYQNQVANAAAGKKYQFYVTLTGVPANAEDLIMNVTIDRSWYDIKTVSSPTNGETVKFVVTVPLQTNPSQYFVCGNTADFRLSSCEPHTFSSKGGGPIRVDYTYPQPR